MDPKIAIVTGAASGIGRHFANVLVECGDAYRLSLADINDAGLRDTFVPSERVQLHRLDARLVQDWQVLIDETLQAFGRIDYLFNIAGGGRLGFLLDQPIENIDFVIDVNLKGPVIGMKLVAGIMAKQGSGHIINVGSLAGLSPTPGNALYSAAKSGLRAASLAAAVELRKHGVYVTLIAPDVVDTPLTQQHYEQPQAAALIYSGSRVLTVQDMEAAFFKAMRDKPLEINLPRWRGWLAKTNSLYPPLMLKLYEPMKKRGLKRLEKNRRQRGLAQKSNS